MKYFLSATLWVVCLSIFLAPSASVAQDKTPGEKADLSSSTFSGLKFRALGPALTSGRIADFAVHPTQPHKYYVAVASGGVWKTENAGTTYTPIFDSQASYSIACVTLDPQNPEVVWVGTGENNGQRSVAYGDGVYKSSDGGKSWKNMGLKTSEHIGNIVVHPHNSDIIYVAVQGPLWGAGGERGLYKSTDGGATWEAILTISEHTGVSEVWLDPRDPDLIYAVAWQRRRHVHTWISGGPESALYQSSDGGATWQKIMKGMPSGDIGRIGLAISPVNPDVVYAIVETADEKGGFFKSTDRGARWTRQSSYQTIGLYYQEIFCDPVDVDRVYAMDTYAKVSDDGGKTFTNLGEKHKHVDNHALWINPRQPDHYMMGCDGGIYTSYDRGKNWRFHENLPITQFYKVSTDQAQPFYHVYGGTQDNASMGGPSRTTRSQGIANEDWFITRGGDGFETQVDPTDPHILYAQAQYGALVRHDRKSGQSIPIVPLPGKEEAPYRWNWDAPLLISPHQPTRLYFAANKLFRSEDRGNSWKAISGDLSRQRNRNEIPVMGKVWSMDAVARHNSTSIYGNITALDESPLQEDLIYAGTDDGLIHVTTDGGATWRKIDRFPGIPEFTYVNMVLASRHDPQAVYAVFNNHKEGDFKPYLLKSTDQGKSWKSLNGNLPERGSTYCMAEDHVNKDLLFAGTEFGVFCTVDGGEKWIQLKGGLPPIAIRDMEIQRRENDLVLASFGRGFFVLDDYSSLRDVSASQLQAKAHIFPVRDAWWYIESSAWGSHGSTKYFASNPPFGATFTFFLKEPLKTLKEIRQEKEKTAEKAGKPIPYPSPEEIRAEDQEKKPYLMFTITDASGKVVRRLQTSGGKGIRRLTWDLRYTAPSAGEEPRKGRLAKPGTYYVEMAQWVNGVTTSLTEKRPFEVVPLNNESLPSSDLTAATAFEDQVWELNNQLSGVMEVHTGIKDKLPRLRTAIQWVQDAGKADSLMRQLYRIEQQLQALDIDLRGDRSLANRNFETPPSIQSRINGIIYGLYEFTSDPTQTFKDSYQVAQESLAAVWEQLRALKEQDLQQLENQLDALGAPLTPGRMPSIGKP